MKMTMFLLVSVVALLVSPTVPNPTPHKPNDNLNAIIDLAKEYNKTLTQAYFVEDLSQLVEDGCKDKFFCKVHDVLHKHEHFRKKSDTEERIVRNLDTFLKTRKANCTEMIKGVTSTEVQTTIPVLLDKLTYCIRKRNLSGNKTTTA